MVKIIGAGVTGLLIANCLKMQGKEFEIISDSIGGQEFLTDYNLGPRILHYSKKCEKFLKELGINKKPRIFKIGYLYNGEFKEELTNQMKTEYSLKTRGKAPMQDSILSESKKEIKGWDIREIKLMEKLIANVLTDITIKKLSKDDLDMLIYFEDNKIISTINLHNNLCHKKDIKKIEHKKIYFYRIKAKAKFDYDYVYVLNRFDEVKRITKDKKHMIIESVKPIRNLRNFIGVEEICVKCQIKNEQVQAKDDKSLGVTYEGRYAQLNHGYKMDDTIKKYYEVK